MSKNLIKRIYTSLILTCLLFLMFFSNYILGLMLIITGIFSIIEFSKILQLILIKNKIKKLIYNFTFIIYIFSFCAIFFIFSNFLHLKVIIFLILSACIFSDIGGFVFGKLIKGPKLTKISPKKTISGAIGSFLFSMIFFSILFYYLTKTFDINVIIIGFTTSLACQIGDLFFSFIKRKSKIKDTSDYLPGHGGVLDRIDGILIGLPAGYLTLLTVY